MEVTTNRPIHVTVVHADACHFCDDAQRELAALTTLYPLEVHLVDIDSPDGVRAVAEHRPGMNPLVLVDGEFFSSGRLPRKKLIALLESRAAATHDSAGLAEVNHGR